MKKFKLMILGLLLTPTLAFASHLNTADSFYSGDAIAGLSNQQVDNMNKIQSIPAVKVSMEQTKTATLGSGGDNMKPSNMNNSHMKSSDMKAMMDQVGCTGPQQ